MKRLDEVQEAQKGAAQQAAKERDDLHEELQLWLSEFTLACRSALKDDSQQLEKLGIPALSKEEQKDVLRAP